MLVVLLACNFTSCDKNDDDDEAKITVKNLTGVDWYNASIVFKESKDVSSKVIKITKIGDVEVGHSITTSKDGTFFYIDARNSRGNIFMSDIVYASDNTSITSKDILINF